jgi:hypothetical protein
MFALLGERRSQLRPVPDLSTMRTGEGRLCDRTLRSGCNSHYIRVCWRMREQPGVNVRETTICRKIAKLIEPRSRRRFKLHAMSRDFLQ